MEKSAQEPESKSASDQSRLNVQRARRERHITGQLCPCSAVKKYKTKCRKTNDGRQKQRVKLSFQAISDSSECRTVARFPFRSRPLHVKAKTKRQIDRAQFRVGIEYFRGARAVVVVVVVLKSVRRRSRSQPHCQHWASFKPLLLKTARPLTPFFRPPKPLKK